MTMSNDAQSQQVLVERANWKTHFQSPCTEVAKQSQGQNVGRAPIGYRQSPQTVYVRDPADLAQGVTVCTSVAMNGSVKRNGAAMALAAENVARWKTYLQEDCVRAMMNAGWHWST
jgi:hypothetical protein